MVAVWYCPKCGAKQTRGDNRYCESCGAYIG